MKQTLLIALSLLAFSSQAQLTVGQTVGDFTATDIHGNSHTLYDYTASGKYVLLEIFDAHCQSCYMQASDLASFYEKYGCNSTDVVVLRVDANYSDAAIQNMEDVFVNYIAPTPPPPIVSGTDGGGQVVYTTFGSTYNYFAVAPDNTFIGNPIGNAVFSFESVFSSASLTENSCATLSIHEASLKTGEFDILYPNPANQELNIEFELMKPERVSFVVRNIVGHEVLSTSPTTTQEGENVINMDLSKFASGNYLVQMIVNGSSLGTKKFSVVR